MKLPEGWKEVELQEILDYEQPGDYIIKGDILEEETPDSVPVLTANKSFILGYTKEKEGVYNKIPAIIFDDFTTDNKFVDFDFKVKSSAMKILRPKSKNINLKFVFCMMKGIHLDSTTHKRYYLSAYQKKKIPIPIDSDGTPDLKMQDKIIAFIEKAEKAKEWRKEADELTKDFLKSVFLEMFGNKKEIQQVELSEVAEITMGQSPSGDSYNDKGEGTPFFQGKAEFTERYPVVKKWTTKPSKFAKPKSVLMSVRAPVGSVNICNIDCCIGRGLASILPKEKLTLEFLFSTLQAMEEKIANLGTGSTFKAITSQQLKTLKIPLPPIELQNKFASIIKEVEAMKEKQKQSKDQINDLFNALMQKAFKGELVI